MSSDILFQAIVYLTAAIIFVPIAQRFGLGSILGYLLAGVAIGPYVLGIVGDEGRDIMQAAQFGVVMMLFLVGLELNPSTFWRMRHSVLGMGSIQVAGTTLLLTGAGMAVGLDWRASLAIGLTLSMSSTAIILQSFNERGLMGSTAARSGFSVSLFQDIAFIPILALLPLLGTAALANSESGDGWTGSVMIVGSVLGVVLCGKFLVGPVLRYVARTRIRELFIGTALLLIIAIAWVMEQAGLSPALGTFMAGVVLANSEFKHELESDIDPFKGLLLGLFFMAVGASIDFGIITADPMRILGITAAVISIKAIVLFAIARIWGFAIDQQWMFVLSVAQVGEFGFVLFAYLSQIGLLPPSLIDLMMAVTTLSMVAAPLFLLGYFSLIHPRFRREPKQEKEADTIDERHSVIIAGFGHFGSTIGRFLRANHVNATILDNDVDRVDMLRKLGFKVFYGDATRHDLLEAAGAASAHIMIVAFDDTELNHRLVKTVKKYYPNLELYVRTQNRFTAYELMDEGLNHIYRETLHTSVKLGSDVLTALGQRAYTVSRSAQNFIKYDESAMVDLAKERGDQKTYLASAKRQIEIQEQLLSDDRNFLMSSDDHAWDSEPMVRNASKTPP
jgi:CPA2 family monovalent cation:H+ antiporter-2